MQCYEGELRRDPCTVDHSACIQCTPSRVPVTPTGPVTEARLGRDERRSQ